MMSKILFFCFAVLFQTSIYTVHFNDSHGTDISMNQFAGKRILLVNIASGSSKIGQIAGLQQLYAQHHDSLAIVVFPSNSFNHEPLGDSAIRSLCENTYGATFTIAAKDIVAGSNPQAIYSWLNNAGENGVASWPAVGDFHKFVIDKDGALVGSFAPGILPTDSLIIRAVTGH